MPYLPTVRAARLCATLCFVASAIGLTGTAQAGGLLDLDHRVALDQRGIWARSDQLLLQYGVIAVEVGGGLWLGRDDPLGETLWRSVDASATSGIAAQALKSLSGRVRPSDTSNPDLWHQGSSNQSFPSGEVTLQAAFVTPLIVRYGSEHPVVWALEALPAYDAIARVKSQAHWQSDVLAGWALGTGFGYWAATRGEPPLSVQVLPGGFTVGWRSRF